MRKLLSLLALFIIFCAGMSAVPYYLGHQFRTLFLQTVPLLSQNNKNFQISVLEYRLGWFSSEAKIKISVTLPARNSLSEPQTLIEIVENHITHGPLLEDLRSKRPSFGVASIDSKAFLFGLDYTSSFPDHTLLHMRSQVDFKNNWHARFIQPVLVFSFPPFDQITSQGVKGQLDFNLKNQRLDQFSLVFQSQALTFRLAANNPLHEIDLASLHYENRSQQQLSGIWTGQMKITAPTVVLKKQDKGTITVQEPLVENKVANPNPNFFDFSFHVSAKTINTGMEPLPSMGRFDFGFAANNLSLSGIQNLSAFFKSLHQPLTPEDKLNYAKLLPKILTATTLITENISLSTPFGDVQNEGAFSWKSGQALPASMQDLDQGMIITLRLQAASALVNRLIAFHDSALAQAPAVPPIPGETSTALPTSPQTTPTATPAAEQGPPSFQQVLEGWIQKGYVNQDGNNYLVLFKHENGLTTLNGKPKAP